MEKEKGVFSVKIKESSVETPQREDVKPSKKRKKRNVKEPTYEPELGEEALLDVNILLKNQLRLYGLSARDAEAVCDFMRERDPEKEEHLLYLWKALSRIGGMSRNKRSMFVESWILARDIPVSYETLEEFGISEREDVNIYNKSGLRIKPRERRRFDGYGEESADETERLLDEDIRLKRKMAYSRSLDEPDGEGEDSAESSFAQELIERAKTAESELTTLKEQNVKLEKEKMKLELQSELDQKFRAWEQKHGVADESTLLLRRIDSGLGRMGDLGEKLIKGAILDEKEKPPERPNVEGENTIFSLIPDEFKE